MDRTQLYRSFYTAYKAGFPDLVNKPKLQEAANKEWRELKEKHLSNKTAGITSVPNTGETAFRNAVNRRIAQLNAKISKKKAGLLHFWANLPSAKKPESPNSSPVLVPTDASAAASPSPQRTAHPVVTHRTIAPKQAELREQLGQLNARISSLGENPLSAVANKQKLHSLAKEKRKLQSKLNKLKSDQKAQSKQRLKRKLKIDDLSTQHPELAPKLQTLQLAQRAGRPTLESKYEGLRTVILDLVNNGQSAAEKRRRTETLHSCSTLDDLHQNLLSMDYQLSRSSLYVRLMPRNVATREGKRHYECLPVKLLRVENSLRVTHDDSHFASATVGFVLDLAKQFGPASAIILSQDDKARVPLGLAAANKQAPILMNVTYKIKLPDHDWPVGPSNKLIPSVYAICPLVEDNKGKVEVSYAGPTYIAIRSGKHDSSTAASHAKDFEKMLSVQAVQDACLDSSGLVKPDENLMKTPDMKRHLLPVPSTSRLTTWMFSLLLHMHLAFLLLTQWSAEWLPCPMTLLVLCSSMINVIWSDTVIGGFDVTAEYVEPGSSNQTLSEGGKVDCRTCAPVSSTAYNFKTKCSYSFQYFLQIVRCSNVDCCGEWRTNYIQLMPNRFVPPPIPFVRTEQGLTAATGDEKSLRFGTVFEQLQIRSLAPKTGFKAMPFDWFCPSVRKQKLFPKRTCHVCGLYFGRQSELTRHRGVHTGEQMRENELEEEIVDTRNVDPGAMPVVRNIFDFLRSEFKTC